MAAKKHINPNQLKLFMTAQELMDHFEPNPGDVEDHASPQAMWNTKLAESKENKLHEDIENIGVRIPVTITDSPQEGSKKPIIRGGHHRLAAAYDINPKMEIPVNYGDSIADAWDVEEERAIADPVLQKYVKDKYGGFGNTDSAEAHKFKLPDAW